MSSYNKSSKSVVVHDDRYYYQRQPSADSSYSRSSTGSSSPYYSTMPASSSSSPTADGKTYRSAGAKDHTKTTAERDNVKVVNHNGRGYDKADPHPPYSSSSRRR